MTKTTSVICIIRAQYRTSDQPDSYWATLRKAHLYSGKLQFDDALKHPDYTWCVDTESVGSVKLAKELARSYAKQLGMRIIRFDERL